MKTKHQHKRCPCLCHPHEITMVFRISGQEVGVKTEKWNISCHISKQRMSQSSAIAATMEGELVSPEGTQEGRNTCNLAAIRLQPLPPHPGEAQDVKTHLIPDSWDAYQRNDFSMPRLLYLPIHRKALNSLTRDTWFSLINNNLLMFRLHALCKKTSI